MVCLFWKNSTKLKLLIFMLIIIFISHWSNAKHTLNRHFCKTKQTNTVINLTHYDDDAHFTQMRLWSTLKIFTYLDLLLLLLSFFNDYFVLVFVSFRKTKNKIVLCEKKIYEFGFSHYNPTECLNRNVFPCLFLDLFNFFIES